MSLGNPKPNPVTRKVFNILAPAGSAAASQAGFNAGRNYFPGLVAQPKIAPPLPVSQATMAAPTAAQIVQQAAGAPRVAAPLAALAIPTAVTQTFAPPTGFAAPAGAASSTVPLAEKYVLDQGGLKDEAAKEIAKKGRIAGLLSKTPFITNATADEIAAGGGGMFNAGGALAAGSIGRGAGYAGLGYLGGKAVEGLTGEQSGTWDDAAQYGVTGAGVGAGIGSVIFPGPGTAIGAGIGGLAGLIGGALWGEDKSDATRAQEATAKIDLGAKHYMDAMGVGAADQTKILAQLQFQGAGLKGKDLQGAYNQLLPQYVDAANQISSTKAQDTLAEQQRTGRLAAIQGYLMPQLTNFLQTAQHDADVYGQQTGNPAYGALQAQTNAAYVSQLAALGQMSQGAAQPSQAAPTLDQYLQAQLAQQQAPAIAAV